MAKQHAEPSQGSPSEEGSGTFPRQKKAPVEPPSPKGTSAESEPLHSLPKRPAGRSTSFFTRNPSELQGEFLQTTLVKSSRGLGFTIIGGDDNEEEFLQIKSVVPNGPAWQDGKLRTGDVLVYVNDTCVLGYTHADVVKMFQNIEPGRQVYLEVCRGYPLPFDPNDPNTEIVTTVAVKSNDSRSARSLFADGRSRNNSSESLNTAKSMPDLSHTERIPQVQRPGSADLLSSENFDAAPDILDFCPTNLGTHEYLTIPIVKGSRGFGFTIADSAYGQKVKKILDRSRCKNLMEGDILVDINNINVKGMSHTEVVGVLKDCPQGQEAVVMVQRGGLASPPKGRGTRKDQQSPKKGTLVPGGLFRSKTPTPDMYSSQPKEIIPNRPKTPLVDTRNRPKTPIVLPSPYEQPNPDQNSLSDAAERDHKPAYSQYSGSGHAPYPGAFSYTGSDPQFDPKMSGLTSQFSQASVGDSNYENFSTNNIPYSHYQPDTKSRSSRGQYVGGYGYPSPSYTHDGYTATSDAYDYEKVNSGPDYPKYSRNSFPKQVDSLPVNQNYVNANRGTANSSTSSSVPGYGYMSSQPKDGYDASMQDSGFSSKSQGPFPQPQYPPQYGHNSSPGYYSNSYNQFGAINSNSVGSYGQGDYLGHRKESTSFEYEHPAPVPLNSPANGNLNYCEFTVTLRRQESGFGFRIVGGTEEGSQVSVGHIVPGGSADQDGTIMTGDEIIGVDGEIVVGSSHHRVVQLMAAAGTRGMVTLTLRRVVPTSEYPVSSQALSDLYNSSLEAQYPFTVTVTRRENEGFGFVIISSVAKAGSTIGRIIEGSPAERCGKLHVGDRILAVNDVDIKSLHHGNIVNLIKESGYSVKLTIGPPRDDASSTASNSQRAESECGDEGTYHHVELVRGTRGFGFSIRGGREFHNMPLFVLRIAENGPAAQGGKLKVGDQLMEINGILTKDMTHSDAIELIKQSGNLVSLVVRRGGKMPPSMDPLSPVGPPPPNTNIRSTATLPSASPGGGQGHSNAVYTNPPSGISYSAVGSSQCGYGIPSTSGTGFAQNGMHRGPPMGSYPLHSSPASAYPSPLGPALSNGPLGQSSPRGAHPDSFYWNRMNPDHR